MWFGLVGSEKTLRIWYATLSSSPVCMVMRSPCAGRRPRPPVMDSLSLSSRSLNKALPPPGPAPPGPQAPRGLPGRRQGQDQARLSHSESEWMDDYESSSLSPPPSPLPGPPRATRARSGTVTPHHHNDDDFYFPPRVCQTLSSHHPPRLLEIRVCQTLKPHQSILQDEP